ncbi:hypothetical protein QBC43DRAFT_25601 [Cladorrhinum sp. PSN259]|nr:hypothetical protein QBC43DRAFT_25601 [Cladorrhinum sp. PSN259]
MHPDFCFPVMRMRPKTFAALQTIIEEPSGPPEEPEEVETTTSAIVDDDSQTTNSGRYHFISPAPRRRFSSQHRDTHQYFSETPAHKPSRLWNWGATSQTRMKRNGGNKKEEEDSLLDPEEASDSEDLLLPHHSTSHGFPIEKIEAQVDAYSRHTNIFLSDLAKCQGETTPLRRDFESKRAKWQAAIDEFVTKYRPPKSWEPNATVRELVRKLGELEDEVIEAKEKLDGCVKKGNQCVLNMLKWDFDRGDMKRKRIAESRVLKREMQGYEGRMKVMSGMDLNRRRGPGGTGPPSGLSMPMQSEDDKRFVECAVLRWKRGKGLLSQQDQEEEGQKRKAEEGGEMKVREEEKKKDTQEIPSKEKYLGPQKEEKEGSSPSEPIPTSPTAHTRPPTPTPTKSKKNLDHANTKEKKGFIKKPSTPPSHQLQNTATEKPSATTTTTTAKQKKTKKSPPAWFLALEDRGVIRKPPFADSDERKGAAAAQRYEEFERWLERMNWKETAMIRGKEVRRWWFGGHCEERAMWGL